MALNTQDLQNLQNGVGNANCTTNNVPTQVVIQKPYCDANSCQDNSPPDPTKRGIAINLDNFFRESCGFFFIDVDNSATGAVDEIVRIGGPQFSPTGQFWQPYGLTGFNKASFIATTPNVDLRIYTIGGVPATAGVDGAFGGAFQYATEIFDFQNALLTAIRLRRFDTSDASAVAMANQGIKIWKIDGQFEMEYGQEFFSCDTSSNSSFGNAVWEPGCGAFPISITTGIEFTIPAGFAGRLEICVGAMDKVAEMVTC